jgi:hypothetical protein
MKNNTLSSLIEKIEQIAKEEYDGHYTIYSFTTNYKVLFGTVNESIEVNNLEGFPTLEAALINAVEEKPGCYGLQFDIVEFLKDEK